MKTKNGFSIIIGAIALQLCYIGGLNAQQWAPTFATTSGIIYRLGNVGIGINAPDAPLHISNTVDQGPVLDDGEVVDGPQDAVDGLNPSSFDIRIDKVGETTTNHWAMNTGQNFDFIKEVDGAFVRKVSINTSGMKLFGTRLTIGSGAEQVNLGYSPAGRFMAFGYKPASETSFLPSSTTGGALLWNDGGTLSFATKDGGFLNVNNDTRMTINPAGNVGIGTTAPDVRLHIANNDEVNLRLDTGIPWDITAKDATEELTISYGGDTPYMRIKSNGRVAIGTNDTPASLDGDATNISAYRLYVEGGILTKEVRVREVWADYVFEKDYHLRPLEEVESFISENGHLPNTPSAEEVAAQGINLGAATANQQEKIEELYLHLIEMNKRLEALEAENIALRQSQQD